EKIKVRQPLQKIMVPVLDSAQEENIQAVSGLIKAEVNVKEIQLISGDSGILVKQIKPNFKVLGPRFGKDLKAVAASISGFNQNQIKEIEQEGKISIEISGKSITLHRQDVEVSSQDIEGWLVANHDGITVALDITITPELKNEGIARELVNRIQNLRKDSGLEVTDKINVSFTKNDVIESAVAANLDYIKTETLTEQLYFVESLQEGTEIIFDNIETTIEIKKS